MRQTLQTPKRKREKKSCFCNGLCCCQGGSSPHFADITFFWNTTDSSEDRTHLKLSVGYYFAGLSVIPFHLNQVRLDSFSLTSVSRSLYISPQRSLLALGAQLPPFSSFISSQLSFMPPYFPLLSALAPFLAPLHSFNLEAIASTDTSESHAEH